jgi:hypothetical protein
MIQTISLDDRADRGVLDAEVSVRGKKKGAASSGLRWLVLSLAAAVLPTKALAHTANICWRIEGNGTITFYAGSWHGAGELPHGGLILDGNTHNFTSFVDPLPGDVTACRGYCCGHSETTLIWQVVNAPDPGSGLHSVTTTAHDVIEQPAGPCATFSVDFSSPPPADCDMNGVDDACQPVLDGDGDGFGDACDNCPSIASTNQTDCQPNGVGDICDLAEMTSQDCNGNLVPDECEPLGDDCNSNLTMDLCDIAGGASDDCNLNGIPDECESPDCPAELVLFDINNGGTRSAAGPYAITASTGQHGGIGVLTSTDYELRDGLWHALAGACGACQLYGDLAPPGGDCNVDVGDILMVLDAFAGTALCPECDLSPCGGDGNTDVGDILAVLDAFSGVFACPDPCPA